MGEESLLKTQRCRELAQLVMDAKRQGLFAGFADYVKAERLKLGISQEQILAVIEKEKNK